MPPWYLYLCSKQKRSDQLIMRFRISMSISIKLSLDMPHHSPPQMHIMNNPQGQTNYDQAKNDLVNSKFFEAIVYIFIFLLFSFFVGVNVVGYLGTPIKVCSGSSLQQRSSYLTIMMFNFFNFALSNMTRHELL